MAAYAALVSLMHIIDQIQHHPRPPISIDKEQVELLIEKVTCLQDFLEGYSHGGSTEADGLESRIADAAYAAEDIIESHIVDQILVGSTSHGEKISSIDFYQGLLKVIEDMDFVKKDVMEIKEKMGVQDHLRRNSSISAGSFRSPSMGPNKSMVGFDDVLNETMDKLTRGKPDRQIIPIVGMGGIGKTTLARNIYENQVVVQYFDILAWVTISQEYSMREILLELILCLKGKSRDSLSLISEDKLREMLYKSLSGRRYLIILDDIWNIEVWDELKFFFPDNNNGSRIILTTRLSMLAFQLTDSNGLEMNFLDENTSWNLLCENVFGKEDCPPELEGIGKKIAKNCKGLPLSIVVIGGLLTKSEHTLEYWEYIAENLNSIVSLEDDKHCLKILQTSYCELPVHLKPCFLYMGVFLEDSVIRVSSLIKLWIAEGFLKPISGKSLELVAKEYFKDLIDRNLMLVDKWGSNGKIKFCKIHDLLRDLCLREAQKEKFLFITSQYSLESPQGIITQRRICTHQSFSEVEHLPEVLHASQSASVTRSLICNFQEGLPSLNCRLLRVLKSYDKDSNDGERYFLEDIFQLVNLRYVAAAADDNPKFRFPSVYLLWNLQTLIVYNIFEVTAPSEIWKMPQLRHVEFFSLRLPCPPRGHTDDFVLENLQTLLNIRKFNCGAEVVKRIPNIKKLKITYYRNEGGSLGTLKNLGRLHKLESLACFFYSQNRPRRSDLLKNRIFPHSLKKLTLLGTRLHWEDMTTMIGSLPLLQVLKLYENSFEGLKWETVEGQFCGLKFLLIDDSFANLKYWNTESTHFPCLEHLILQRLRRLEEIPLGFGEIPTLQSIQLNYCSDSAAISAKAILEEQEELGNDGLQVRVSLWKKNQVLQSLASRNFQVEVDSDFTSSDSDFALKMSSSQLGQICGGSSSHSTLAWML